MGAGPLMISGVKYTKDCNKTSAIDIVIAHSRKPDFGYGNFIRDDVTVTTFINYFCSMYNRRNFHKHTFCIFRQVTDCDLPKNSPDFRSKSGSEYYFTDEGVFRKSNHWGRAANCKWRLQSTTDNMGRTKIGYAGWNEFYPDNDIEKLYYIVYDEVGGTVTYHHKSSRKDGDLAVLRTASATMKIIKQIRTLLEDDRWARHFETDIEDLRMAIIGELIHSNKELNQIKAALLPH